jgi:cystine transport system substrate-binding protein
VERRALIALPAAVLVAALLAGCAGAGGTTQVSPSPSVALQRATAILGHPPAGLAGAIVARGVMVVGADAAEPPQSRVATGGALEGFDPDVARSVAAVLGLAVRFEPGTPRSLPERLRDGAVDVLVASTPITPATERLFGLTEPYYYSIIQTFVRRGGAQVADVSDLFGRVVGVRAYSASALLLRQYPRIRVEAYPTDADAFAALRRRAVDFVVAPGPVGQRVARPGGAIVFSGAPLRAEALGFAVEQGQTDWLALLDHAIARLRSDGVLEKLSRRWFFGVDMSVED